MNKTIHLPISAMHNLPSELRADALHNEYFRLFHRGRKASSSTLAVWFARGS